MSCPAAADFSADTAASRRRISTACEACRVAKVRCLPSDEDGVCQKCLVSKKECVSRTGPRRRRPNRSKLPHGEQLPPPPKPTGTFTIDIPLSGPPEPVSSADTLRQSHSSYLDNLFPADPSTTTSTSSPIFPWRGSTTSSEAGSHPSGAPSSLLGTTTTTTAAQPSFNIASAEALLATFRQMLPWCPCVLLPDSLTVASLARTRPFLLLAVLAAAAAARSSLRGHDLYDDEFRRVLALKLVARGERSLELLQGLLVYCLWHPFHLRPRRVRQVLQYTRMAADLVRDLELDIPPPAGGEQLPVTPERLDTVRAYVAQHYLSSTFAVTWQAYRSRDAPVPFTAWTERCCQLLAQHAACPGDAVLASLARLGRTVRDAWTAVRDGGDDFSTPSSNTTTNNIGLVFRGLEAQFQDQKANLPPAVANALPVRLQTLFTEFFLLGGSVLRMPTSKPPPADPSADPFRPTPARFRSCVDVVAQFLALLASLPTSNLAHFSSGDWGRLVLGVVVAMRLSFHEEEDPDFDAGAWARGRLGLGEFLEAMTARVGEDGLAETARRADVVSASKVVLAVVREKYEERLASLQRRRQQQDVIEEEDQAGLNRSRCPMLDGSLDCYFPLWDSGVGQTPVSVPLSFAEGVPIDGDAMLDTWIEDLFDWIGPRQDVH
ncbi:Zn(2)-C6 fungal-type DNA-binding domain protein [Cordyceps fumosorosea ARSEF 2679]|uniref:Zn(2)-C6 fungal-type DNA-binding domain protein n=1 Tax=Cordyceps fumosorosea (strain ARSEF 2679) TaxID=1081104 RepID=A0A167SW82_CORFA|nr:Zn(2)-C6 fungal-type DNA-binding domain protein [Cordyceps fumosorosea ARSEF 2679]OAA59991.1 Zn(2)-C6 fungal-type DNA-binding domain protein [Cordyceps fumosorosea ARSEF 2679]